MDPVTVLMIAIAALGVALVALSVALAQRWDQKNRRRYPDRASDKFFEMNREKRTK